MDVAPGALATREVTLRVAAQAPLTAPYFSLPAAEPAIYDWSRASPEIRGLPFEPPTLRATFAVDGAFTLAREVSFRFDDQARGEVRRPVTVVPRLDVEARPGQRGLADGGAGAAPVYRDAHARGSRHRPPER